MPDFFLEVSDPDQQLKHARDLDKQITRAESAQKEANTGGNGDAASTGGADSPEVIQIMEAVKGMLNEDYVKSVKAIFNFSIAGMYTLVLYDTRVH
jgi:hypothetical protein